jgi:hypothetical protein
MVLDRHREAFDGGIERRTLGNRPRQQNAVPLEPEVVVEVRGAVFLDDEAERACRPSRRDRFFRRARRRPHLSGGLGCTIEAALLSVDVESHVPIVVDDARDGERALLTQLDVLSSLASIVR